MADKKDQTPAEGSFSNQKIYVWVKALESKINNLLREVDVLKTDFIKRNNNLKKDLKVIGDEILELRHTQEKAQQKVDLVIKELKQTAGIEEVLTLRKYVEFWNPINFVTQRDLQREVETQLSTRHPTNNKQKT